jgi:hypothetical protein
MLWPTLSWPSCLGVKPPSRAQDQNFVTTVAGLLNGVPSLMKGQVCCLKFLLALASRVVLGSEPHGTQRPYFSIIFETPPIMRGQVPISPGRGWPTFTPRSLFPTSYNPPPCGCNCHAPAHPCYMALAQIENTASNSSTIVAWCVKQAIDLAMACVLMWARVYWPSSASDRHLFWLHYSAFQTLCRNILLRLVSCCLNAFSKTAFSILFSSCKNKNEYNILDWIQRQFSVLFSHIKGSDI